MNKLIYDALSVLFNNTLAQDVRDFLSSIMDGLFKVFSNADVTTYFKIFTAAAGSLLIIFFLIDLAQNATRDMITLERLILAFIKLIVGLIILMYLPEILTGLFNFIRAIYNKAASLEASEINKSMGIKFQFDTVTKPAPAAVSKFPKWDETKFVFIEGNAGKAISAYISAFLICTLTWLGGWAARLAAYFLAITNAVTLIARAIFSPIAVAQCFDEGQRSVAIRYLKKFAADGLALAIILGLLYAASVLQANVMGAMLDGVIKKNILNKSTIFDLLANMKGCISIIVINFSCIGAIMKSNQLAQDVIGA